VVVTADRKVVARRQRYCAFSTGKWQCSRCGCWLGGTRTVRMVPLHLQFRQITAAAWCAPIASCGEVEGALIAVLQARSMNWVMRVMRMMTRTRRMTWRCNSPETPPAAVATIVVTRHRCMDMRLYTQDDLSTTQLQYNTKQLNRHMQGASAEGTTQRFTNSPADRH
jgi:hypothetical protein